MKVINKLDNRFCMYFAKDNDERIACEYKQLSIEIDYELGGMNYFTGRNNRRGYYIYVIPCNKGSHSVETTLLGVGSGRKLLLKEVKRKSNKAFLEAKENVSCNDLMLLCQNLNLEEKEIFEIYKLLKGEA